MGSHRGRPGKPCWDVTMAIGPGPGDYRDTEEASLLIVIYKYQVKSVNLFSGHARVLPH